MYVDTLGVFETENPELVESGINMFMTDKLGQIIYIGNPIEHLDGQIRLETVLDSIRGEM